MFKKLISLVVCLSLCLTFAIPANAMMISSVRVSMDDSTPINAAAVLGDLIYFLIDDVEGSKLMSRTADSDAVTEVGALSAADSENALRPDQLFTWNGKLYGLSLNDKTLFALVDEAGAFDVVKQDVTLDLSALVTDEDDGIQSFANVDSLFAMGDYLYYTARSYDQGMTATAGRINLTSGKHQMFGTANILSLAPYENDKLVAYIYDMSAIYGSDNAAAAEALKKAGECAVFDPETDAVITAYPIVTDSQYGGMVIGGFCYGNNTAYYQAGSKIMGINMATGESRVSAYTASGMFGGNTGITVYINGYYMTFGYDGFTLYKLDSESLKKGALRIYGEMGGDAHKSFVKNYPDIPVEVGDDYTTSLETITQAMVSDTNPYDVLQLSLNYMPVERLLKKGYCADLSGYPELMDVLNQMYPDFAQVLQQDGKLYGVPVDASAQAYGVNMELWTELGLTEEDLPTSMPELLDFAANWVYDYADDYPDIHIFNYGQSSMMLFSLILQDYMAYTQRKGEPMLFDTPVYRELLAAFETVDFTEIDNLLEDANSYVQSDKALFSLYTSIVPLNYKDDNVTPLYLSIVEGEEVALPLSLNVMIINPKTTRMDDAILYMKNYLENLPRDGSYVTLFPEHNEPVEMRRYNQVLEEMNNSIKAARERLETAAPENRASIEDEIKSIEDNLIELENHRYTLSAEEIQNYRDNIQPKLFVQRQNLLYSANSEALGEINTLMMQYLAKTMDADKMIAELDNRLRLMALEDD